MVPRPRFKGTEKDKHGLIGQNVVICNHSDHFYLGGFWRIGSTVLRSRVHTKASRAILLLREIDWLYPLYPERSFQSTILVRSR